MAMHNTNSLLKYVIAVIIIVLLIFVVIGLSHRRQVNNPQVANEVKKTKNTASVDSAAESLDTLTAELSATKSQVSQISKDNAQLKTQNDTLIKKLQGARDTATASLEEQIEQIKTQLQQSKSTDYSVNTVNSTQAITTVPDLTQSANKANPFGMFGNDKKGLSGLQTATTESKPKVIPYYTIPANSTAVHDRMMTALIGRIPIKGVVTDPYPFKIVFSDDTLAANGLRVSHLRQMVVSGYVEGDLNLLSARGWVTSLTFVFDDGRISTTTSNNNDIGHFTKENALGYLSDERGNPFLRGKLITNAPTYVLGNVALGAAQGATNAYAQSQTTNQTSLLGSTTSSVTGSPGQYIAGQAGVNAANQVEQWWHDRQEQSFDAIYVSTTDENGNAREITVNFAKEIQIDYNLEGRKIDYAKNSNFRVSRSLD